jgi:hypothetical protein
MRAKLIKLLETVPPLDAAIIGLRGGKQLLSTSRIADHLLANGVTVLPCKIGDTVWGIRYHTGVPYIKQGTVSEMAYLEDMRLAIAVKFAPKYNTRGFWGVTIFATREECEAALGGKDNG